jgi:hypothetical protein
MGFTWALGGAVLGVVIEGVDALWSTPLDALVFLWIPLLAVVGFVGGVAFAVVLGLASRRHRLAELSLPGFTALGAVGGLVLGGVALVSGLAGNVPDPWLRTVIVLTPPALGCAVGASLSLVSARAAEEHRTLEEGSAMRLFYGQR